MTKHWQPNHQAGLTFLEVMVAVSITLLILIPLSLWQRDVFQQNQMLQSGLVVEQEAQGALKNFLAEMRSAETGNDGSYLLQTAGTGTISFFSDIDRDGIREKVRYFIDGKLFKKGVIEPTGQPYSYLSADEKLTTIAVNMVNGTSSVFSYFGSGYDGVANISELSYPINVALVRLIKINLLIDVDPNRSPVPLSISSQVMIRNLKDNL